MPTLTADQIEDYRMLVGDACSTDPNLTNPMIQSQYDKAYAKDEDEDTTEALTVVYILRRLLGLARTKVDLGGEMREISEKKSQYFEMLEKLLKYWGALAGLGGAGSLSVGTLSLDIDYTEDDLENENV